jgi:hypothetical protein
MRFFIAGGGCYGSYYLRQLDRARQLGKVRVTEMVVVDRDRCCALSTRISEVSGARLEVADWLDFGEQVWRHRDEWQDDMWVPTPIGPHILYHWVMRELARELPELSVRPSPYTGVVPPLPYAQVAPSGALVLSHAPGLCPTNCVEPKLCPLTKADRDWEMKDTVTRLIPGALGVFVCQHYRHGVGTIRFRDIYAQYDEIRDRVRSGERRVSVATVSSCHGILDSFAVDG